MSFEKVANWLKSENEDSPAEEYISKLKSDLSLLHQNEDFALELKKNVALGNKIRFSIYKTLGKNEMCACVMSKLFDVKEATLSHHLKILREAGLIEGIRKGLYTVYRTAN
jgi:DNA-binding transcriptional ArsR family regulator